MAFFWSWAGQAQKDIKKIKETYPTTNELVSFDFKAHVSELIREHYQGNIFLGWRYDFLMKDIESHTKEYTNAVYSLYED